MTDEEQVGELLLRWEELKAQGRHVTPDDLCRDCPHLAPLLTRRIHALTVTAWMDEPDDPPDQSHSPDSPLPTPLGGRYRLDQKIAEGGFAEVWRGYDLELRRAVAVKLPKPGHLATGERAERFVAEARRVARLKHPGVVPVFDVGRDGDTCFIVSELVEGGSLADRLATNRPTPQEAVRLVAEVAETLAYAHRQGFVHRDIKPGNILIDHHGRALVADLGIARSPDERESVPTSFGTLAYMSPEQVRGEPVDHRSDIYGLGVVLYELLAGKLPHDAQDPVGLRKQIVAGPVPGLPPEAGVTQGTENICLKCLSRNPTGRYQDAGDLAADLRRAAGPDSPPRPRFLAVLGVLVLVVITAVLVILRHRHQPPIGQPVLPGTAARGGDDLQSAPGSLDAALALAKLHFKNKEWGQAEAASAEAIRLDPQCAEAYHLRAGSLFNAGKVKESIPDFDRAADLEPQNAEVCKNRGIAYLNLLRFDEAIADLRHALDLDPDHPEPYRKVLGEAYARRAVEHDRVKAWKEAVADMGEAIRFDATNAGYFDRRGSFRYNLGQFKEAVADFGEAIRLDGSQPAFYLHRGFALEAMGRKDEAAADYEKGKAAKKPG